jgi:hypothetical protein
MLASFPNPLADVLTPEVVVLGMGPLAGDEVEME